MTAHLGWRQLGEASAARRRRHQAAETGRSFAVTFVLVVLLAAFLSPMLQAVMTSLKSSDQLTQARSPIWPATPVTFSWEGEVLNVYEVPIDGTTRQLALLTKGRRSSTFLDPAHPDAGEIAWDGSWRALDPVWQFSPRWENFTDVWRIIDYPRLLLNTVLLALFSTIGTVLSCVVVAYGFARFRFPGRNLLFTLLIATIFLPSAVTLIPTYTIFVKLGWVGTWLPLLVPTFFANAFDVFLLRQYFMTVPRDLDEAASIDGAGPVRILRSVLLPQAMPAVIAVAIFHFVYSWNDYFGPLIYLSTKPELQPLSVGLSRFNGIHYQNPGYIQAGTLMTLAIPVVLFIVFQRVFTRGIVITGVEK